MSSDIEINPKRIHKITTIDNVTFSYANQKAKKLLGGFYIFGKADHQNNRFLFSVRRSAKINGKIKSLDMSIINQIQFWVIAAEFEYFDPKQADDLEDSLK